MTDRDKLILEEPEKMCEYCCNFDREHIGMDCTALCKLTMTLAYAEDYGGNCMFYNVPKEQIIVPPCKVGDTVYYVHETYWDKDYKNQVINDNVRNRILKIVERPNHATNLALEILHFDYCFITDWIKGNIFLTKEEAEEKLRGFKDNG